MVKVKKTKNTTECSSNSLEDQYSNIMKYFDFDMVHEFMSWEKSCREYDDDGVCYKTTPWKIFISSKEGIRVPTVEELKSLARKLIDEVINKYKSNNNYYYITAGPFKASILNGRLELECVIESWTDY